MTADGITRGYDYMNESSISERIRCPICNHPFTEPVITPCDHTFCKACIKSWLEKKTECYTCRTGSISSKVLHPANHGIAQVLDRILVRCLACEEENIRRGDFPDHLANQCQYHPQKCPASDLKCPWVGLRNQVKAHRSVCVFESLRPILEDILTRLHAVEKENQCLRSENQELKEELVTLGREYTQLEDTMKNNEEHGHSKHSGNNVKSNRSPVRSSEHPERHKHAGNSDEDKEETHHTAGSHIANTKEKRTSPVNKHA